MTKPKYLLLVALITFSTSLFAQNDFREVGLSLGDNFNMAFVYKQQKAKNRYISYDVLMTNFGITSTSDSNPLTNFSTGLSVTFEKRKDIGEKIQFIRGWSPGIAVSVFIVNRDTETSSVTTVSPSLGYRMGFLYQFSENFYASLQGQVVSRLSLQFGDDGESITTFRAGFSQQDVNLNLVYRFKKKA